LSKNIVTAAIIAACLAACGGPSDPGAIQQPDAAPAASKSDVFDLPYLMKDLDNGLRVIIVETDYPDIVTMHIPVQTGSRNEVEPGKSGFAHFFEHMMFRGTEKYPGHVYTDILKKAGADQNAYTTDDYTNYHVTFTKEDLERIIEIEADRFQNLKYSEEAFRTEALAVKGEYLKNFSNPLRKAYARARAVGFTQHTYRHTAMGFIEDIEAMPEQFAYSQEFFDRWYRPEKSAVIIVGDVDANKTFDLVEKHFGSWERGSYSADIPAEPPSTGPVYEHIEWDSETQPYLLISFRGPAYAPAEKDMPAIDLLASIYFSDSSELYRDLVLERQLVDQLVTYFPDSKDPNLLTIYARLTDASHATDVEHAILDTLVQARTRLVDERRVAETKSRLRYLLTQRLDSSGSIGRLLAGYVHFWRSPETLNEVYRSYDALTAQDLRAVANEYFVDASRVTVTLSPDPELPGAGVPYSIDALVAATEPAEVPPGEPSSLASVSATEAVSLERASSDVVPVSIVTQQTSSPLVDVSIIVHAGAAMDPPGKKGLASVTAAMIADGGSTTHAIDEINAAMYPIAAGFDAQVDKEMTRLSGQVHKDNLETWYELVRGQLLAPGWREQDFERVKTQTINAIRTGLVANNDEELGKEVLYAALFRAGHPYGDLNLGAIGDIESLSLDDVRQFYADHYTINNINVGLSGGYPDAFVARLSDDLQSRPAGAKSVIEVPPAHRPQGNKAVIVEKETPAVAVSFGFPLDLKRGDPDWVALWLARSFLGEHRSTNSHLFKRIRDQRGLNYGDYAYIEYFPRGMFRQHPSTNLARQQQIFQVWIRPLRSNNDAHFAARTAIFELDKLITDGMSESDFEATRAYLSKYVSLMTDGQSRQLGYAIDSQYYEIGPFADYVRAGLDELTLDDVNRVIRENLSTENVQYVFVTRDAGDLRDRLLHELPSPLSYDAEMPAELLREDELLQQLELGFDEDDINIVSAEHVFR
jgi:zinc protease